MSASDEDSQTFKTTVTMSDEEWSTNATDATTISLWQPAKSTPTAVAQFPPAFTYPIFGDEESIFGYKDLHININFAAHDLRPNLSWQFAEKFKPVGETEALDLKEAFADFVPKSAFSSQEKFLQELQGEDAASFVPPGKKQRAWTRDGRHFEIWAGQLSDPAVRALIDRIQVLVPLFIEGGMELQLDDQEWTIARWRVFFVYEKLAKPPAASGSVYSFVGYSTTYRFVTFDAGKWSQKDSSNQGLTSTTDFDVLNLPYRGRISQFLILPPYSHQGHGSMLYATIYKHFYEDENCIEITVEDPNEAFDDLRDYCDFARLLQDGTLERIRMNYNVDPKLLMHGGKRRLPTHQILDKNLRASIRKKSKIASRQFKRLVELWLLSRIPTSARQAGTARLTRRAKTSDEGDRAYYFWRLLVKQRIWNQNKDSLKDLEQSEAVKHLEDTVDNVAGDYERLLASLAEKAMRGSANEVTEASSESTKRKKRSRVVEDDDDAADDDDYVLVESKRQKSVLEE